MVMIDGRAMKKTTWIVHEPELKGQHEIVLLVQDESIVESERCASAYFERGKGAGKEKGKGITRMISDYIHVDGRLMRPAVPIADVSEEEKKKDQLMLDSRYKELSESQDPVAKAIVVFLQLGYLWSGHAATVFLGLGVTGVLKYLLDPSNDIDMYRDVRVKKSRKKFDIKQLDGWTLDSMKGKGSAVVAYSFKKGSQTLLVDLVHSIF